MEIVIIFPNSLFEKNALINKKSKVFIVEHSVYFSLFEYHKLRLIYHRATMKNYASYLKEKYGCSVTYIDHDTKNNNFEKKLKQLKGKDVHYFDPVDHIVEKDMTKYANKYNIKLNKYETPLFINTTSKLVEYSEDKDNLRHDTFYIWQRKTHNILITGNEKPKGGKWSFDSENRNSFPQNYDGGYKPKKVTNKYIEEATNYVNKNFKQNIGMTENYLPIDHDGAKRHLKLFFKNRFKCFGKYQDAVKDDVDYGCHSFISPMMNIGLLTPKYVVNEAEKYGLKNKVPLSSIEGFIRQIIGWREYVRMLYILKREGFEDKNHFGHNRRLGKIWYKGTDDNNTTGFAVLDDMINKMLRIGYLHHIERLMYVGNWFLINEINPKDSFKWFMIGFLDSYNWVMYPNVYGMSQHSSGPIMMTRPYFSSSSYIERMSNYKKKKDTYDKIELNNKEYEWYDVWDAIYYNFISQNVKEFAKNYAISRQVAHWKNKSPKEKKEINKIAKSYNKKY